MRTTLTQISWAAALVMPVIAAPTQSSPTEYSKHTALEASVSRSGYYVGMDPRPYYLMDNMTSSPLKTKLQSCENGPFQITTWSIGHRGGGTLQFPEETQESTTAGARMGAVSLNG